MAVNFDINKGLQNKTSRKPLKFTLIVVLSFLGVIVFVFAFLSFNGKHVKTPIIETNIPVETIKAKSDSSVQANPKTQINIKENHGDIIIK